ncbi:hypothetical protein [Hyphomonas sp. CACIAM 19H1]|uniref:hypothetical protein n=1 Tax=Hyphomonas sp. CACIAM 19H1 TaxID=1873716 RepID=UPI0013B04C3D|nr:hypothetical protein [Hyphomonas sp. CACIAM 19H1]
MIPNIQAGLSADRNFVDGTEGRLAYELERFVRSTFSSNSQFWRQPYFGAVLSRHWDSVNRTLDVGGINQDLRRLRNLCGLLLNQTSETIDDFIVENPSYSDVIKICIAVEIMKRTYDLQGEKISPKSLEVRTVGAKQRNWIHLLINLIRHGIRSGTVSPENKIKIISFNYDGILEYVLDRQFENTESQYDHYTNYIDIVHPHGQCGNLNVDAISSPFQLTEWASGISVVNERNVGNAAVLKARKDARGWVKTADTIYAAGFAFSGPNCDLIGLRNTSRINVAPERSLHYCNYDGSIGVTLSADRCDAIANRFHTNGTSEKPISVEDWILSGHLGEMPG